MFVDQSLHRNVVKIITCKNDAVLSDTNQHDFMSYQNE